MTQHNISQARKKLAQSFFVLAILMQLSSCAFAPWEKPAINNNTPEANVLSAQKKLALKPADAALRKNLLVTIEQAVTQLATQAEQARLAGDSDAALRFYDRILNLSKKLHSAINLKKPKR